MCKIILVICFMFTVTSPAKANNEIVDPVRATVKDLYKFRTENLRNLSKYDQLNYISLDRFYLGFLTALKMEHGENVDVLECLNKDFAVWSDIIFDQYKSNMLKGSEKFFPVFYGNVAKICKVPIAGYTPSK